MTQISKFQRHRILYLRNTHISITHGMLSKIDKVLYYNRSLDKLHRINLTQLMFSDYSALIVEINSENIALKCLYIWKQNLTLLKNIDSK